MCAKGELRGAGLPTGSVSTICGQPEPRVLTEGPGFLLSDVWCRADIAVSAGFWGWKEFLLRLGGNDRRCSGEAFRQTAAFWACASPVAAGRGTRRVWAIGAPLAFHAIAGTGGVRPVFLWPEKRTFAGSVRLTLRRKAGWQCAGRRILCAGFRPRWPMFCEKSRRALAAVASSGAPDGRLWPWRAASPRTRTCRGAARVAAQGGAGCGAPLALALTMRADRLGRVGAVCTGAAATTCARRRPRWPLKQ